MSRFPLTIPQQGLWSGHLLNDDKAMFNTAECIAFEDSGHGLRAAAAAGIACVVTPTRFTAGQCFDDALRVLSHLGDATDGPGVGIDTLRRWHGGFQQRSA